MKSADIAIVGSGSLARAFAYGISLVVSGGLRVTVLGRSEPKVSQLVNIANARSASLSRAVNFTPCVLQSFSVSDLAPLLRSLKAKVILVAASLQSPWEFSGQDTAWTELVLRGGFGITLPLQLHLAAEISRSASELDCALVNACYPDCVNVVLYRLGLRTTCGIGNSAIVEAFCRSKIGVESSSDVRVIGHHGQLNPWIKGIGFSSHPRIWVDDAEIESMHMRPELGAIGEELNQVTGCTAIRVVMSLLTKTEMKVSIPGVTGLPGGYPFTMGGHGFELRLPPTVSTAMAIEHNQKGERLDGISIGSNVDFVPETRHLLRNVGFDYPEGFAFEDWPLVCSRMLALRERLRLIDAAEFDQIAG